MNTVLLVLLVAAVAGLAGVAVHHWRFVAYHRYKGRPVPEGFAATVVHEGVAWAWLGWWHVRAFLQDGLRYPLNPSGRIVLCVHGYSQNATNFHGIRRALERAGRPTVAVSMVHRLAPIPWYSRRVERRLDKLAGEVDGIDVVAHSMGGVVLRLVLSRRPDLAKRLRTVVTLGSPHAGTAAARGIPLIPEIRALRRSSGLLAALPPLSALAPDARIVTIAGTYDTIVYPVETTFVPGGEPIVLDGIGHAGLLTDRRTHQVLLDVLTPPSRPQDAGPDEADAERASQVVPFTRPSGVTTLGL